MEITKSVTFKLRAGPQNNNWQVKGNAEHAALKAALKAAADKAPDYPLFSQQATPGKKTKKLKKVQSEHPLFESSTVPPARCPQGQYTL